MDQLSKNVFFAPPATVKQNREKGEMGTSVISHCPPIIIGALLTHTGIAVEQTDIF